MTTLARHLVSGSKRRTQTGDFDLDLTYITPRMIALGLPASGLERLYRNPLSEVRDFLDATHPDKYAMVNLCDERDYSNADFPRAAAVWRFPFADHHPSTLAAMHEFCRRTKRFLDADEKHVIAVHCKAGKGRTGVMICAYLLYAAVSTDPEQSLHFFRSARTTDLDAVNNPSQEAYVRLYARLLAAPPAAVPKLLVGPTITLVAVTLSSAPASLYAGGLYAGGDGYGGGGRGDGGEERGGEAALVDAAAAATMANAEDPLQLPAPAADVSAQAPRTRQQQQHQQTPPPPRTPLTGLVLPSWHLKLAVSSVTAHENAEGVRSVRTHVATVGPLRCGALQPRVRFELPNGGLRVRGDLQLSLLSAAGLIADDSELGWAHVHTSWMPQGPPASEPASELSDAERGAGDTSGISSSGTDSGGVPALRVSTRVSALRKAQVDGVGKDHRFPSEWRLLLHYACDEDDEELVIVEREDAA